LDVVDAGNEASALDRLVELGALDVEALPGGGLAALMPDAVAPARAAAILGVDPAKVAASPATSRDAGSVWVLRPRPIRVGRLRIVPANGESGPDTVELLDSPPFGTGLHPTTALCLQALQDAVDIASPNRLLDVGTGSGVLALGALRLGVARAVAVDIDDDAVHAAADNARLNGLFDRLRLVRGGPDAIAGAWPLVVANILAGPLIEMAPTLVRRTGHQAELILSGIPSSVAEDVDLAYRRLGLRHVRQLARDGWVALVLRASW
jgi:ribosomal protein L11 methyltransferase